ncbi:ABC-F family ATP-binding cassette domain-containing protein [Chengkuizengella sediminis]|uniref:ABC-F family ATP-binding cassette domain-containing protein n=1 Tax=Chengkuizengella sediminis TaxID=1885917 RepID=UPI001389B594|nr:ABC-F family ATP-binding cassette domain-containing protein [Chengkuizengella sediminis]NDI34709.1 ABC-F family ATP-binding cassette domain-containing protein [Chengkuizengella sediminis]
MLVQASNISKSYGIETILSNASIQIEKQERIGIVGVNGAGKSTFMKIIAGELSPTSGDIFKAKEISIGYLAQNSGLNSDKTIWNEMLSIYEQVLKMETELRLLEQQMSDPQVIENTKLYEQTLEKYSKLSDTFKEQGGYEIEANIRGILHGMGFSKIPADSLIENLSGGQKTRLALAKLLLQSPDVILLDEPTNYLDLTTLSWLESFLRSYDGAVVVVSHDRYFLDALVNVIYEIERTTSKRYTGNYTRYLELKAQNLEIESKKYEKQQAEISKMQDFVQKNLARASTTKRAQSRRKALEKMEVLDKPIEGLKKAHFTFQVDKRTGNDVLKVNDLSFEFEENTPLFKNVTFHLYRGDSIALIGPNGTGKSTLLNTLIKKYNPTSGTIDWGSNIKLGFYDQEQKNLNENNTVLDELWDQYPHLEEKRIRTVLGNFLFSGDDVLKKISSLSGGEKARVSLAKLMLLNANVLILDEPTNHLDLFSREVLESALMDYEGTLLFISHDRYFLNKLAEKVFELSPNGMTHFLGNFDDYVEKKAELEEEKLEEQNSKPVHNNNNDDPENNNKNSYELDKQKKRDERNRTRRIEALEKSIHDLEEEISEIEKDLADPEIFNDYVLVQEKTELMDQKKVKLKEDYEEWETLL